MEPTGNYHMPTAYFLHDPGFYVSVVNAMLVRGHGNNSLRRAASAALAVLRSGNRRYVLLPVRHSFVFAGTF